MKFSIFHFRLAWSIIIAWTFVLFITNLTRASTQKTDTGIQYHIVIAESLNMRVGPDKKHQVIKILSRGTRLDLRHVTKKSWALVKDPESNIGWVLKKYIRKIQPMSLQQSQNHEKENVDNSALETAIKQFIVDVKRKGQMYAEDNLSLIIKDLHSDKLVVSINPNAQVKAASLIKVPILHAYMIHRFRGKIVHSQKKQWNLIRMIRLSDNPSTNQILRLLGGPWGAIKILENMSLYQHLKLVEYIPRGGKTYLNKISAEDLNRLFILLWDRQVLGTDFSAKLNEQASDEMLYILGLPSRKGVNDRLKDGTCFARDHDVKIWDKTGFVRGLNADVGIIEINTPEGRRPYSIISIIDRPNYRSIRGSGLSWAKKQSRLHRRISEMSYAYFKNKYGDSTTCGTKQLTSYIKLASI